MKQILINCLHLVDLEILQSRGSERFKESESEDEHDNEGKSGIVAADKPGKQQIMESLNLIKAMRQPHVKESVTNSYQALSTAGTPLCQATHAAVEVLSSGIHQSNSTRWFGKQTPEAAQAMREKHVAALERLREETAKFPTAANDALLQSHEHLFDDQGALKSSSRERETEASSLVSNRNTSIYILGYRFGQDTDVPGSHVT